MPTRQRVVLVVLMLLSVVQQGVRWQSSSETVHEKWEAPAIVAPVEAAEVEISEQTRSHCQLVHVNTAGMAELQTLPGIGPIYAERIIIERKERYFVEKHDLLRVSGIGEKRLSEIVPLICLHYDENVQDK